MKRMASPPPTSPPAAPWYRRVDGTKPVLTAHTTNNKEPNCGCRAKASLKDRPGRPHLAGMGGQVALVPGGARGIRLAISNRLAERGAKVAVGYSHGADTAKAFAAAHEGATIHQGNIGVAADCERVISEVLDQHGRMDILGNNDRITIDRTVRKMSVEDWDRVIHVNLSGAFYLARAVLQHMLDRGYGRIINISSVIGEKGNIGQANYSAAGSGLFGLTNSLADRKTTRLN